MPEKTPIRLLTCLENKAIESDKQLKLPRIGKAPILLAQSSQSTRLGLHSSIIALTWSLESLDTPIFSATRCTLRVLVPVAYISTTAATRARSTRWWRSITSSRKKLPERSMGVPAQVSRLRSRQPFQLFAPPPHSRSASASITTFKTCAASPRSTTCMSMAPSSKRGMASISGVGSD